MGSFSDTSRAGIYLIVGRARSRRVGSPPYTPSAGICLVIRRLVCLTCPVLKPVLSFGTLGVSLTRPVLESVWSIGRWGVSVTCPRAKFCLVVCRVGNPSYTPRNGICLVVLVDGESTYQNDKTDSSTECVTKKQQQQQQHQ